MTPTTKQAILQVLRPEPDYMTAKDVFDAVRRTQPGAVEATVRNELSIMVSNPDFPVVSVRSGLYAKQSSSFEHDVAMVAGSLRNLLNGVTAAGISVTPDGYRSPALALCDCIFSARARYSTVTALIARVCRKLGITDADEVGIGEFVNLVKEKAGDVEDLPTWLAETFFENRSYAAKDLTKAVQVFIVAKRLRTLADTNTVLWNLDTKSDFDKIATLSSDDAAEFLSALEIELTRLRGWGPALHRYLLLLLKVSQVAKPDTRIIEFIARSLGRPESSIEARYAAFVFEDAVRILNDEGLPYDVIEADHAVWLWVRGDLDVSLELNPEATAGGSTKPLPSPNASQIGAVSVRFNIGDKVTSKSGSPTGVGEVVGHDPVDPLRVIVKWPVEDGVPSFNVEQQSALTRFGDDEGGVQTLPSSDSPNTDPSEGASTDDFLDQFFQDLIDSAVSTQRVRTRTTSTSSGAHLDNHGRLEAALAPHRGKRLTTQQMWNIVDARWDGGFTKGSFLPNDHAQGNKGACWCAVNRQNRPLFQRIGRGVYLIL